MANNHLRLLLQPIILFSETMAILVPALTVLVCLHVFAINSVDGVRVKGMCPPRLAREGGHSDMCPTKICGKQNDGSMGT